MSVGWGQWCTNEEEIEIDSIEDICNLTDLSEINLSSNGLAGEIPSCIGNLTNLTCLNLSNNQLTGSIPSEIGNLTNLWSLCLNSNQLTGSIPSEIGNLTNLWSLYLNSNQLSSEIPESIFNLNTYYLKLGNNQLTGEIPENISNQQMKWLYHNRLTGQIPESVCENSTAPDGTKLSYNQFLPPYPDCLTENEIGFQWNPEDCDENGCPELAHLSIINVNPIAGTLDIYMENSLPVFAIQISLIGMTLTGVSGGTAGEYFDWLEIGQGPTNSNTVYGAPIFTNQSIPAGEDVLVTLSFTDYNGGEICLPIINNITPLLVDLSSLAIPTSVGDCYTPPECDVALGDVTGDSEINILDLVQIANLILETSTPDYECAADYNGDGQVNILDLVQIANYILDN